MKNNIFKKITNEDKFYRKFVMRNNRGLRAMKKRNRKRYRKIANNEAIDKMTEVGGYDDDLS